MTAPNHSDLNRALGRVEGDVAAVKEGIDEIKKLLRQVETRLTALEADRNQRKGALAVLMTVSGIIGGLITKFGAVLLGGGH